MQQKGYKFVKILYCLEKILHLFDSFIKFIKMVSLYISIYIITELKRMEI
ncbi:hypothetical protein HMPREF0072_1246 [Anaerococcus lactolyticus ATCC 51172]|uniref:Uncharacterized protein n=1 Tax=Anaerococcus lactolyticus ATCC 51172 TaxID=525254 RepID=C2BFX6_9FIRM|nr:hypothetical protein HMPREF0072_1246 [Anaerococcus lactolyticus ATCC 51172]